jgi:hypothetical protein
MIKKVLFSAATFALAVASAASSYRITVYQASFLNGTEIQPGEYRLELKENTAVIKSGKQTIEAPVKVETTDRKAPGTSVRYSNENGKTVVDEIWLGGTNTRLVFRSSAS